MDFFLPVRVGIAILGSNVVIAEQSQLREVLQLVASGLTYKEVGARLHLSPRTGKDRKSVV